jgi:hypothetical protein
VGLDPVLLSTPQVGAKRPVLFRDPDGALIES